MFQICHCGTQPGYQHDAACPFPLFTDDDASVERWARERAALDQRQEDAAERLAAARGELESAAAFAQRVMSGEAA